jgi:hypothetical protein
MDLKKRLCPYCGDRVPGGVVHECLEMMAKKIKPEALAVPTFSRSPDQQDETLSQFRGVRELAVFKTWEQSGRPAEMLVNRDDLEEYVTYLDDRRESVGDTQQNSPHIPIRFMGTHLLKPNGTPWMWSDVVQRVVLSLSNTWIER